jgi:hypothetical protein
MNEMTHAALLRTSTTGYFARTLPGTTAHDFNVVLPEGLPETREQGEAMKPQSWEKRVAKALLRYARLYAKVYEKDYGHDTNGAEDYVPEGWDTAVVVASRGCPVAFEEHIFETVVSIAFAATSDTGWVKSYDGERWTRKLVYEGKSAEWLACETDRLYYRAPGFWSDDAQVEWNGSTATVTLVSHNEGEV